MSDIELFSTGSGPDWRLSLRHDRGQVDLSEDQAMALAAEILTRVACMRAAREVAANLARSTK